MFFIPILIVIAIVGFSYAGTIVKDLHLGLPNLNLDLGFRSAPAQKTQPAKKPATSSQTSQPAAPRAPPSSNQTTTPQQKSTGSPYAGKIRISNFQATTNTQSARITLYPNFNDGAPINITKWKLKSTWNGEFSIPSGVSIFHPTPLSDPTENIAVQRNDTVYLRGEQNPLGRGINFRPNSCFGYLAQYYQNLPESFSCNQDRPSVAQIKNLSPACQEFILNKINYGSCTVPNYSTDPSIAGNQECISYITSLNGGFNYEGCYQKHRTDPDFLSTKWYVYMDTAFGNSLHDSITLYDQNGLVVDSYTY